MADLVHLTAASHAFSTNHGQGRLNRRDIQEHGALNFFFFFLRCSIKAGVEGGVIIRGRNKLNSSTVILELSAILIIVIDMYCAKGK